MIDSGLRYSFFVISIFSPGLPVLNVIVSGKYPGLLASNLYSRSHSIGTAARIRPACRTRIRAATMTRTRPSTSTMAAWWRPTASRPTRSGTCPVPMLSASSSSCARAYRICSIPVRHTRTRPIFSCPAMTPATRTRAAGASMPAPITASNKAAKQEIPQYGCHTQRVVS